MSPCFSGSQDEHSTQCPVRSSALDGPSFLKSSRSVGEHQSGATNDDSKCVSCCDALKGEHNAVRRGGVGEVFHNGQPLVHLMRPNRKWWATGRSQTKKKPSKKRRAKKSRIGCCRSTRRDSCRFDWSGEGLKGSGSAMCTSAEGVRSQRRMITIRLLINRMDIEDWAGRKSPEPSPLVMGIQSLGKEQQRGANTVLSPTHPELQHHVERAELEFIGLPTFRTRLGANPILCQELLTCSTLSSSLKRSDLWESQI